MARSSGGASESSAAARARSGRSRGTSGAGVSGEVVLYRIDYDWPLWTAMLTPLIGHDGKLHIQTSTVVRNEPWNPDQASQQPRNCDL